MNYITLVFIGGLTITRKINDLFSLSLFKGRGLETMNPEGYQVIVNWDNVLYVREAEDYEIESAKHHEEIRGVV